MQIEDWPSAKSMSPLYRELKLLDLPAQGHEDRFLDLYRERAYRKASK